MKLRIIIFLLFFLGFRVSAQFSKPFMPRALFGHSIRFDYESSIFDQSRHLGDIGCYFPDSNINKVFDNTKDFDGKELKSLIALGVKLNPTLSNYNMEPIHSFSKSYSAFRISDGSDAILIAAGITKANVASYRYRVVVNDSIEVIHWSPIKLAQLYGAKRPYGFIGKFIYPNKQVLVEVVNINNYNDRDGVIFDWRKSFKPFITNFLISSPPLSAADSIRGIAPSPQYDNSQDPVTHMVSNLRFVQDAVGKISIFVKQHDGVPYEVSLVKKENGNLTEVVKADEDKTKSIFKFDLYNRPAGNYAIMVRPLNSWNKRIEGEETSLDVTISQPIITEIKIPVKQILPYLIGGIVIIGLLFLAYRRYTNVRLAKSAQEKKMASLSLKSIRSQLNPHFMFNALTSIQNLMNKNDTESANHYLSRFADLTRKVLNTSTQELISLDDEIKILDDYLQMEQLRFNFKYQLNVDDAINRDNTDVPAMLLQPFVENAVKHGVANLREKGIINVTIKPDKKNLLFSISDNGAGFQQKDRAEGNQSFGLKLSEERIKLLNEVYADQPAILNIQSGDSGTTITVTLTNWIS